MTFDNFIKKFGFKSNPFNVFTAEDEREFLSRIFVEPIAYSPAEQAALDGRNVFIYGERGTGKTALLLELAKSSSLHCAVFTDYSSVPNVPTRVDVYNFYLNCLAFVLMGYLIANPLATFKMNRDDRILISYLLAKHTTSVSKNALSEKIKKIQNSLPKRLLFGIYNHFACRVLNIATTATVDAVSTLIAKSLGVPLMPEADLPQQYFKSINLVIDESFNGDLVGIGLIEKVLLLCEKIGLPTITLVLDRIDEHAPLKNDADLIADFIRPFLVENSIFYLKQLQLFFSVWSIPYQRVKSDFRANKFCVEEVAWTENELKKMLIRRMEEFSINSNANPDNLFEDVEYFWSKSFDVINNNPRDLWQLMKKMLIEQFRIDSKSTVISKAAVDSGIDVFVRTFNFYEYYPRNAKARVNTMDVYSYISHLLKLGDIYFTNNSLDSAAGTGSSTSNYVVGMQSIGLVRRCDEKGENGATKYQIRDPKVVYALRNRIEIRRDA